MSAETNDSSQVTPEKKSNTTLLVLLVILGLGVAGLVYDRRVARPGVEKAYDDLVALVEKTNRSVTESVNPEDVQAVVGRAPVSSFDEGDDFIEVFAWRSGLPIRTHKLYAVYTEQHGEKVLYRHAKYKYEKKGDVIAIPDLKTIEVDPEADTSGEGDDVAAAGGAGGEEASAGGGGPGGGGPGGGGRTFDPEARFTAADADGDGVLREDEISDRMQESLSEIDTDGDGEISKAEFMARMEAIAARSRGGSGDAGSRPPRSRPEAESSDDSDAEAAPNATAEEPTADTADEPAEEE